MSTRIKIVAVVEDDSSMQRSIERLLAAYGFATELYASAEDFLTRAPATAATCALVDINLPGMSGIELRRRLTQAGSNMPVIFMTATDDHDTERQALAAGCLAYLHKPFPARLLVDAINQAA
jgi:FixJ family two-component response regulator